MLSEVLPFCGTCCCLLAVYNACVHGQSGTVGDGCGLRAWREGGRVGENLWADCTVDMSQMCYAKVTADSTFVSFCRSKQPDSMLYQ